MTKPNKISKFLCVILKIKSRFGINLAISKINKQFNKNIRDTFKTIIFVKNKIKHIGK